MIFIGPNSCTDTHIQLVEIGAGTRYPHTQHEADTTRLSQPLRHQCGYRAQGSLRLIARGAKGADVAETMTSLSTLYEAFPSPTYLLVEAALELLGVVLRWRGWEHIHTVRPYKYIDRVEGGL